jgi:ketopantoate reductase
VWCSRGSYDYIEIAAQNADVQLYVRAELKDRIQKRKLRIRRQDLEEEIIEALIAGAQGM